MAKKTASKKKTENRIRQTKTVNAAKDRKVPELVAQLVQPLVEAEGLELVFVEYQRESNGKVLRLYIDKPGGVTLEDCTVVSRQAGDLLDVYLPDVGPYSLEISSPGQNRPLGKPEDYDRFQGRKVKIKMKPVDDQKAFQQKGMKSLQGILLGISDDIVKVSIDEQTVTVPYERIHRAHLVG